MAPATDPPDICFAVKISQATAPVASDGKTAATWAAQECRWGWTCILRLAENPMPSCGLAIDVGPSMSLKCKPDTRGL